jgi:hypothetical protein
MLRRYIHKQFPMAITPVIRRDKEPGVAELDFGFLGKTIDGHGKVHAHTAFLSVRFRYSRNAFRISIPRMDTEHVILALMAAFEHFGAVPHTLVIDNFKVAIVKHRLKDPTVTRTFHEFAVHCGFMISPCAPGRPEHKGGVESDVKYVKRNFWPLYRDHESLSGHVLPRREGLDAYFITWNKEVALVRRLRDMDNRTPLELWHDDFEALKELPATRFEMTDWTPTRILGAGWHISYGTVRYSVPQEYMGKPVHCRATRSVVEVYNENHELIARHARSYRRYTTVTVKAHGPTLALEFLAVTRANVLEKATRIGPNTAEVVRQLLDNRVIDRLDAARGIVFLTKKYPDTRIEAACARALAFSTPQYHTVKSILEKDLDQVPIREPIGADGQRLFAFVRDAREYNNTFKESANGINGSTATDRRAAEVVGAAVDA